MVRGGRSPRRRSPARAPVSGGGGIAGGYQNRRSGHPGAARRTTRALTPAAPAISRTPGGTAPSEARRARKITSALSRVKQAYRSPNVSNLSSYTPDTAAALIKHVGGSTREARDLSTKVLGESGGNPRAVGHDPGGTTGLGLWQLTTGVGNDDLINRHGGPQAMLKPTPNAKAALELYRGGGLSNWYAGSNPPGNPGRVRTAKPRRKDVRILHRAGVPVPRPTKGAKAPKGKSETAKQLKGHYINPYKGLSPGEIDQGVDYGGSNDVKAIGNAVVKDTHGSFSGDWIAYTLTDGPRKGWTVYVAEHVAPKAGLRVGQKVKKGDVIGHMSGGIETGWAAKPGVPYQNSRTLTASQNPSYVATRHNVMSGTPAASDPPEGRDFLAFLNHKPGVQVTSSGISFSGSAGPSTFASALGITTTQAKQMTPRERLSAARKRLNRVTAAYGSQAASGSPAASTGALSSKYGHPAV